ncbi:hypothetical protein ACFL0W_04265 [Nanoarchaeota archaeon]
MYIRPKIKNKAPYAVLVKCERVRKRGRPRKKRHGYSSATKPKEILVKHLGRIVVPEKLTDIKAVKFEKRYASNRFSSKIKRIAYEELKQLGFCEKGRLLFQNFDDIGCFVDLGKFKVYRRQKSDSNKTKPLVIQMNEGFMCDYTLKKLVGLAKKEVDDIEQFRLMFANAYLEAGLPFNRKYVEELFKIISEHFEKKQSDEYIKKYMPKLANIKKSE